jgi:hypothetical protein
MYNHWPPSRTDVTFIEWILQIDILADKFPSIPLSNNVSTKLLTKITEFLKAKNWHTTAVKRYNYKFDSD